MESRLSSDRLGPVETLRIDYRHRRTFIQLGGHQLQLNAVDRDTLIDAQKHPEKHRQLIVRVWGWSGHFVQLDRMYQDQIIARTSYSI